MYYDFIFQPVIEDGRVTGIFFQGHDVTDREEAARQRQLLRELQHRVKNTLATVLAIAMQTQRTARCPSDFSPAFEGRLIALAKTHDVLVATRGERGDIADILRLELQPHEGRRIRTDGPPPAQLASREAVLLGMVVHELATNAAKYGALSTRNGQLDISWRCEVGTVVVEWEVIRWAICDHSEPAWVWLGTDRPRDRTPRTRQSARVRPSRRALPADPADGGRGALGRSRPRPR